MDFDWIIAKIQSQQLQVGALLREQRLDEALALAEMSARDAEHSFGALHPNTAATLSTLGGCLSRLDRQKEALEVLEQALEICRSQTGDDSLQTAQARNNLSAVYRKLRRSRAALFNALETLRIRRGQLPANDPAIATAINNLGFALSSLGDITAALVCYRQAAPFDATTQTAEHNYRNLLEQLADDPRFMTLAEVPAADLLSRFDLEDLCEWGSSWLNTELEEVRFTLRFGRPAHLESYQHYAFQLKCLLNEWTNGPEPESAPEAALIQLAQERLIKQVKLPVSTRRLTLKRIDRLKLGPLSLATLACAFPNFTSDGDGYTRRLEEAGIDLNQFTSFNDLKKAHLEQQGIEAVFQLADRQFRRYAGDNNLPRNAYSSVCLNEHGDDGQTLCRELYEYTDLRIPGFVFVGDTWDQELMAALEGIWPQDAAQKNQGIFVFLLPPVEEQLRPAYRKMYEPVLSQTGNWDGLSIVFIPTELHTETYEHIVDLRQQETQQWFAHFFKRGDGAVFLKSAANELSDFTAMLPALVYPEFGGSGVTKSIGTWMRLAGINGLVFPAARSDAQVVFDDQGAVQEFYGWNFVDYRNARLVADREVHIDLHSWYDFVAGRQEAPVLHKYPAGWQIRGQEKRYKWDRSGFIQLLLSMHGDLQKTDLFFGAL